MRKNYSELGRVYAVLNGVGAGQPLIANGELRGRVNGYTYEEFREARGYADCQETRRAWRSGRG